MRSILVGFVLSLNFVVPVARAAECGICPRAEQLSAGWTAADTPQRRLAVMKDSHAFLKAQVNGANSRDEIGAVVRTIGAVYARDYDPLNDLLSLYRARLADPEYRRTFDEEVERLAPDVREKVKQGLINLASRPNCQGRGTSYRCS